MVKPAPRPALHGRFPGQLSWEERLARGRPPHGFSRADLNPEQRAAFEAIALDIFTELSNLGAPLPSAILGVYLSGVEHGSSARDELNRLATVPEGVD